VYAYFIFVYYVFNFYFHSALVFCVVVDYLCYINACVSSYLQSAHTLVFTFVNLFGFDSFQHFYSYYWTLFFSRLVPVAKKQIN